MLKNRLKLVVGLGNPGNTYQNTRHNAGFMIADKIAQDFNIAFNNKKFDSVYGRGLVEDVAILLAKPMAFMNRCGPPVQKLAHYYRIQCEDMLVIHDDIDLAYGRFKIKEKGGHGGHKGLKSLIDAFGSGAFARIRLGVGRSEALSVTDHVLGRFGLEEKAILDQTIIRARDAVVSFFIDGTKTCMNRFNKKMND